MTEPIKTALLSLPAEIAASATQVYNLQTEKNDLDADIKELELTHTDSIWGNAAYTNEGKRKSVLKSTLTGDAKYQAKVKEQKDKNKQLALAQIEHQKLRDTMNCMIAIAGVIK